MESSSRPSVAPSFEIKFLHHDAVYRLDFLNSQQLALYELTKAGAAALHEPAACYRACERVGLISSISNLQNRGNQPLYLVLIVLISAFR